jgi:hypothetical protein
MLFRTPKRGEEVATGAVFHRLVNGRVVDTAEVLALSRDSAGIPHVRFNVHHERTDGPDELRTLSVAVFREIFTERVAIAASASASA